MLWLNYGDLQVEYLDSISAIRYNIEIVKYIYKYKKMDKMIHVL